MIPVVDTNKQNCHRCYSCVRECPAKAIKIEDGQAKIITERCLTCGHCIKVCTQKAKIYQSHLEITDKLLNSGEPVAALLAPSFPAEFSDYSPKQLLAALRQLGFAKVVEVAAGAALITRAYRDFLATHTGKTWISSCCPALNSFICKYYPDLVSSLIPIVSPMVATAMAVKNIYGEKMHTVFIGPCIAKKSEIEDHCTPLKIEAALTFEELRKILPPADTLMDTSEAAAFDAPLAGNARIFALKGGLIQAAKLHDNSLDDQIIPACGSKEIIDILRAIEQESVNPQFVDGLLCAGCINGPGMTCAGILPPLRHKLVSNYIKSCPDTSGDIDELYKQLDLFRIFMPDDHRLATPSEEAIRSILARSNKFSPADELNCGACGYKSCREKAIAVYWNLAEETMCLPFMVDQAERLCIDLNLPYSDMRDLHRRLLNTERLASLGQLSANIAHELNNPLGTILLFSGMLKKEHLDNPKFSQYLDIISNESQRCRHIISALLNFAKKSDLSLQQTEIINFLKKIITNDFSQYDLKKLGINLKLEFTEPDLRADIDQTMFTNVLVNLIVNAIEAMYNTPGDIIIHPYSENSNLLITITDQGCGITPADKEQLFEPFFSTKKATSGTGLGLPIAYGVIKMHNGSIWCESSPGRGTTFYISIPRIAKTIPAGRDANGCKSSLCG